MRKPIAFSSAEAIIEQFWDPGVNPMDEWDIECFCNVSVRRIRQWDSFRMDYSRESRLCDDLYTLQRKHLQWDVSGYDRLLSYITAPKGLVISIEVETDKGILSRTYEPAGDWARELPLDLDGARIIKRVRYRFSCSVSSGGTVTFKWIGLQAPERLQYELNRYTCYDSEWKGLLKGEDFEPEFNPTYSLVVSREELDRIRRRNLEIDYETVDRIMALEPESYISTHVNFWDDTRFSRERDFYKRLSRDGYTIVEIGVLLKNKAMVRQGCRIALSLLMCSQWYDSFMAKFPMGTWEHRGFVPSIIAYEIGMIMDLAGEFFTPLAIDMFLRRLSEDAEGTMNYVIWKHEYMFHNNQVAWFSYGRLLAYAIISAHYPRARRYMDLAFEEVYENVNNIMMDDGGYGEGPSYFTCIGQNAMKAFYFYSRATGKPLNDVVPERLRHTEDFIELIISTDRNQEVLPICDGHEFLNLETEAFLSYLTPDSMWPSVFKSALGEKRVFSSLIVENLISKIEFTEKKPRNYISMPNMGSAASVRDVNGKILKIFMMGNQAGIDHAHEDKGSFIVEYDGKTVLRDAGTTDYALSISSSMQMAEYHNMLIPYGFSSRPHPNRPNQEDIVVLGNGDEDSFFMSANLSCDWPGYYRKWIRTLESERRDTFLLRDEWKLEEGGKGVCLHLNTLFDVKEIDKGFVVGGIFEITSTLNRKIVDKDGSEGRIIHDMIFTSSEACGTLEVRMRVL